MSWQSLVSIFIMLVFVGNQKIMCLSLGQLMSKIYLSKWNFLLSQNKYNRTEVLVHPHDSSCSQGTNSLLVAQGMASTEPWTFTCISFFTIHINMRYSTLMNNNRYCNSNSKGFRSHNTICLYSVYSKSIHSDSMCCSRNYPYPSHRGIFGLNPPIPLEIPVLAHTSFKPFGCWDTPPPWNFQ